MYAAILRQREALHGDGVLIGDLFRLPGMDSAYLTGLVVEASPAEVVRDVAVYVAELGLRRIVLGGSVHLAGWSAEQLDAFNARVQAKRSGSTGPGAGAAGRPSSPSIPWRSPAGERGARAPGRLPARRARAVPARRPRLRAVRRRPG